MGNVDLSNYIQPLAVTTSANFEPVTIHGYYDDHAWEDFYADHAWVTPGITGHRVSEVIVDDVISPRYLQATWKWGGDKEMEIGGTICHLCGAKVKTKNTYERRTKRGAWKRRCYVTYTCKTEVMVTEKEKKQVTIGSKCVTIGHE